MAALQGVREGTRLLEGLTGSVRVDDPEYGHEACAVVRGSRGQQVVYATDRGLRDYPGARRTPSFFPRSGQGQKERAGSRPPFPARPKGVGAKEPAGYGEDRTGAGYPPSPEARRPAPPQNEALAAKRLPLPSALCKISNHCIKTNYQIPRRPRALQCS